MANDDNEYGNLVKNFFVSMLILISMLTVLPLIFYGFASNKNKKAMNDTLIDNYEISSKDQDKFNTLEELYLFCTYIPIKRVRVCGDSDEETTILYKKYLKEAGEVIALLKDLYEKSKIGGEKSMRDAKDAIAREKEKREQREHEEMLANQREAGANSRNDRKMFFAWVVFALTGAFGPFLSKIGVFVDTVIVRVMEFVKIFTPIIVALASNRVFVGFIILVIIISIIFGLLKPKDKAKSKKRRAAGSDEDDRFGLNALWEEIVDTYEYYRDMANNLKLSNMSGGLIQDGEENAENDEGGLIIDRKTIKGKAYDNLSYVMLSDIFSEKEISEYYGKGAKIDRGRYYNIHLPDEKFKSDMPSIKWDIRDGAKQNEKVWRIDCDKIDTLANKDGAGAGPAFVKEGNKCVINARGLDKINKPPSKIDEDIPFKTEFIR
jgi:hypothetical protein